MKMKIFFFFYRWIVEKKEKEQILKIWLDGGVEDKYSFLITSEKEISKSGELLIPKFDCLVKRKNRKKKKNELKKS